MGCKRIDKGMKNFNEICKGVFDKSEFSICITDTNLEYPGPFILYVNPIFQDNTGYAAEEVIGKTPRILQGPKTERSVLNKLKEDLKQGKCFEGYTINYKKDGSEIFLRWTVMEAKIFGVNYYVALQKIADSTEVIDWIEKIKEIQLKIIKMLEK